MLFAPSPLVSAQPPAQHTATATATATAAAAAAPLATAAATSARAPLDAATMPRIRVCVRKRPLGRSERARGESDIVRKVSGSCLVVGEPKVRLDLTPYTEEHRYHFDEVFDERQDNQFVYRRTAAPLVETVVGGGKATWYASKK
jgi:hypothetical protein